MLNRKTSVPRKLRNLKILNKIVLNAVVTRTVIYINKYYTMGLHKRPKDLHYNLSVIHIYTDLQKVL